MGIPDGRETEAPAGGLGHFVRRLLGGASLISLASILQQGIGFFLLPVYTRYLTPEDYGHIEVLMVSVFLALMVVGQGLPPAVLRALTYVYADDERRARAAAGTALVWIGITGTACWLAVIAVSRPLSAALMGSPEHASLVIIGGALVGMGAFISVSSSILLAAQRVSLAIGVGLVQFVVKLGLNILLIVVLEVGFAGIIWSQLAGEVVGMLCVIWLVRHRVSWGLRPAELRPLLGYGVPLIGSTLGQQLLLVSDRYVLQYLRPGADLGLYAVANKFSAAFFFIVLTPVFRMWEINGLELVHDREGARRIARLGTLYLVIGTNLVLAALWLGEPVLRFILPPEFVAAEAAVGLLIAGSVFYGLGEVFKVGMRAAGAAGRQAVAAGLAAVFNLGLTFAMVPALGFIGAAIATAISFAAYAAFNAVAARTMLAVPWDRSRLLLGGAILLAVCCLQPWLVGVDSAARFALRGWLLLSYMALSLLMVDDETRASLRDRLRPELLRRWATAGGAAVRDLIVMALFYGMLPFAFRLPWVGVLMWCWVAIMNPHQLAWGLQYQPVAQMVGLATLAGFVLFQENTRGLPMRLPTWLMVALWGWAGITTLMAHDATAAWSMFSQTSKMMLFVLLSLTLFQDVRRLRWLLAVIAGSVAFFGVKGAVFALATGGNHIIFGPPNSRLSDNNDLALALNMTLPLMIFFARSWTSRRGRVLWAGAAGGSLLAVLFTYSRGGVVALCAVLAVTLLRSRQRLPAMAAVVVVLIAALVFAPQAWVDRVSSIADYEEDASAAGRFNSWRFAWNLALDRPIVGGGFGAFNEELFQQYAPVSDKVLVAHSIYFDLLATQGFPGLLLFLTLLLTVLWRSERLRRLSLQRQATWFSGCAEAIQLATIAFMVGGAFLSQSWNEIFYHFVGALVVLELLAQPVMEAEVPVAVAAWQREAPACAA